MSTHQNRLALEPSPYLQQHAGNPVDWYPWGPEALSRARAEDKPILLSIGYAACHWCHVMEHESFEDETTAELMNRSFISIKVDREERPELDQIYQTAVQLLGVRGGWPLTVFLTPELEPFYGGTYFPPTDRYGMPAFTRVLQAVADLYQNRRDEIHKQATQLKRGLEHLVRVTEQGEAVTPELLDRAARVFSRSVDPTYGGFHGAPKFPQTMALSFLLRYFHRTQDRSILDQVTLTLRRMAEGGIYDHLGGGFHRYAVDERWFVPHFEKMLYDNALLLALYAEATQLTGDPFFAQIAEEIATYVLRDMRHPEGGFFATQDADSEGEEGKYYVWTQQEIFTHLGGETGELFCRAYGVTAEGNWEEDVNILRLTATPEQLAKRSGRPPEEVSRLLAEARAQLFAVRERRVKPFRDEKILTGWNGLMISGLAQAAKVCSSEEALEGARGAIRFVEAHLMREGKLLRSFKDGQVRLEGTLDDYAFFIQGLLDTAEVTGDVALVEQAQKLAAVMVEEFWDAEEGGFYFVGPGQEDLLFRPKSLHGHAIPAGSAVASQVLLRLARLGGPAEYRTMAEETFQSLHGQVQQNPFAFGHLLTVMEMAFFPPPDVIIVGKAGSPDTEALVNAAHQPFLPNKALLVIPPGEQGTAAAPHLKELLAGKGQVDGQATAYVCRDFTCSPPVTDPEALLALLTIPASESESSPEAGSARRILGS